MTKNRKQNTGNREDQKEVETKPIWAMLFEKTKPISKGSIWRKLLVWKGLWKCAPVLRAKNKANSKPISEARRDGEQGRRHKSHGISTFGGCESV